MQMRQNELLILQIDKILTYIILINVKLYNRYTLPKINFSMESWYLLKYRIHTRWVNYNLKYIHEDLYSNTRHYTIHEILIHDPYLYTTFSYIVYNTLVQYLGTSGPVAAPGKGTGKRSPPPKPEKIWKIWGTVHASASNENR